MGRICELKSTAAVADETVSASAPAARRENEVNDRSMRGSARVSRLVGECHFRFLAEMIWPTEHTKHTEEIEWAPGSVETRRHGKHLIEWNRFASALCGLSSSRYSELPDERLTASATE